MPLRFPRISFFHVPFHRRLETLGAVAWVLSSPPFALPMFLVCTLIVLNIPFVGVILFASVLVWTFIDRHTPSRGGRKVMWVRQWKVWEYFRNFFPAQCIKTCDLDPKKNYIFGYHPHGILATGAFVSFATEATGFARLFPGIELSLLTLKINFLLPFYRDYLMSFGIADVSEPSCKYILSMGSGHSLLIVVGGASESLETHPGTNKLTLLRRKGFVRIGLQTGSSLVPVFGFGENDLYVSMENPPGSFLRLIQEKLLKFLGFALPVFHGRGIFNYDMGLLPFRIPLTVVVGSPIDLPKIPSPSKEEIDHWHRKYLSELQKLYDQHKDIYAKDRKQDLVFAQ